MGFAYGIEYAVTAACSAVVCGLQNKVRQRLPLSDGKLEHYRLARLLCADSVTLRDPKCAEVALFFCVLAICREAPYCSSAYASPAKMSVVEIGLPLVDLNAPSAHKISRAQRHRQYDRKDAIPRPQYL